MSTSKRQCSVTLWIKKCLLLVETLPGYPRAMLGYPRPIPLASVWESWVWPLARLRPTNARARIHPRRLFSPADVLLPSTTSSSFLAPPTSSSLSSSSFLHTYRVSIFLFCLSLDRSSLFQNVPHIHYLLLSFFSTSPYQETHTVFTPSRNRRLSNFENSIREHHSCIGQHSQRPNKPNQSCI